MQQLLIFVHLPKTAGTTLARIIERQYGRKSILRLYDTSPDAASAQRDLHGVRAVLGHLDFGLHRSLDVPSAYVTLLRDPVSRVISHYHFVQGQPSHYLHAASRELGLREFVAACGAHEPNNDQTRMLAGDAEAWIPTRNGDMLLAAAKHHLNDHFLVTGLTEDFDRSVLMMKRALNWRYPFYTRVNVGTRPRLRLSDDTVRVIQTHNRLDMELYAFARDRFDCQMRQYGASLERELQVFKQLNSIYGRLYAFVRPGALHRGRADE